MTSAISWKSFGASVVGPAHVAAGKRNQDAWSSFHHVWGDGIVVSDGLGSKPLSEYGSDAACRAVERAVRGFAQSASAGRGTNLLGEVLAQWLDAIAPLDPRDAAATCLFAFRVGDGLVRLGILGDGCVAVVRSDDSVLVLIDDKTDGFSNMTTALARATDDDQWTVHDVPEAECTAVVLCTDGVSDDLDDVEGFMAGFVAAHRKLAQVTASRRTRELLDGWPVPKHSDDKTIACLVRVAVVDE